MKVADTLYFYSFGNKILKHLSDILIYMELNLNLYMTVLTITFPYLSGRCKVTLYSNRTIYPRHTPQSAHSHRHKEVHFPQVLLRLLALSRRGQGLRVCAELSERVHGRERCSPRPGTGKAAGCCWVQLPRGSGHMNLTSLGKHPQFRLGPQSDFFLWSQCQN